MNSHQVAFGARRARCRSLLFSTAPGAGATGSYLTSVTDLAVELVPGVLAASVTLLSVPSPRTPAYTGQLAWDLDQVQI